MELEPQSTAAPRKKRSLGISAPKLECVVPLEVIEHAPGHGPGVGERDTSAIALSSRAGFRAELGVGFGAQLSPVAFSYSVAQGDGGTDRSSTARVERNGSVRFGELQHNGLRKLRSVSVTLCEVLAE